MQPFCVTKKDFIFCRNFIVKGSDSGGQKWMLCDTAGVGGGRHHHSTGSPFGHHPRLSIVCPRRGQWVSTWSILRGLSSVHHEISMYLSVDTLSHAPTTAAANIDNASRGGAPMHNRGGYPSNKRGGTRGKVDRGHSDAGGVALKAWRERLTLTRGRK